MSTIEKLLRELSNDKSTSGIYLREIALLMEENEELKDRVREKEKEIKNLIKHVRGKNNA
tara:strand:+ start:380 stop:559 length:180 start_codon:yes stop_codon:yes gene_type:complete